MDSGDYYKQKLIPLFFEILNTPREDRPIGTDHITPYLNGGLFEARGIDRSSSLDFPKTFFPDLYEFLEEYNFTTDESTSHFEQVAIDPEMLGRIFENLLAEQVTETGEQARKAKGAFYTPREIVDYMCVTSLKTYLEGALEKASLSDSEREKITKHLFDDTDAKFALHKENESYDAVTKNRGVIITALGHLTILDPACGSGAFPMGMMQAMIRMYERVMTEASFDPTTIKLGIIERSIHGVDIEPMAVEIARLRAWLSIVVDEPNDSKLIKPLPNLDFKFVCANSLISLEKEEGIFDKKELMKTMQEIRKKYYNARTYKSKEELKKKFEKLLDNGHAERLMCHSSQREQQLLTYHPFDVEQVASFFDPEFMFGEKEFDIVIGNPPYGNLFKDKQIFKEIETNYSVAEYKIDAYSIFIEKGLNVTRDNGKVCFITPYTFLSGIYFSKLRILINSSKLISLVVLGSKIFKSAEVDTCIFLIQKGKQNKEINIADFR